MFLVSKFVRVLNLPCASISDVTPSDQLLMYLVALYLGKLINRCWYVIRFGPAMLAPLRSMCTLIL